MFYTSQPEELRRFIRDKLGFTFTDVGDGWLIFDLPEADMGCHPAEDADGARSGTSHLSFYCDDIDMTVAELKRRGVEFAGPVVNTGWGLVTQFKVPGDFEVMLYQPLYPKRSASKRKAPPDKRTKRPSTARGGKPRKQATAKKGRK
jgi:hypothetical protein